MQAMPMINQPAVVNEAVVPRATRSGETKSDDGFLPVLNEARRDNGDNELAGAAVVDQNQDTQQQVVVENRGDGQPKAGQGSEDWFVATDEIIAETAVSVEQSTGLAGLVVNDLTTVASAASASDAAPVVATQKVVDSEAPVIKDTVGSQPEAFAAESEISATLSSGRSQPSAKRAESANAAVAAQSIITPAAVHVVAAQGAASVVEIQPLQQLNIQPLKKNSDQGVTTTKTGTEGASGNSAIVTDPRFATLLNKPEVGDSLRQQQGHETPLNPTVTASVNTDESDSFSIVRNSSSVSGEAAFSASVLDAVAGVESLGAKLPFNQNNESAIPGAIQAQGATVEATSVRGSEPIIPLRDGSSVPEGRVVQQTIDHLTLHSRGESSSVTVRLHPEELGELQLRMVMEGDQLKVHLQVQSQQVQEVLERNFPRLRDALQDQGVTVDDFQVSVDSGERGDQQFSEQREFVADMQADHFSSFDHADEAEMNTPVVESRIDGRRVSLRV